MSKLNEIDKKIIMALENGIPLTEQPFQMIAEEVGISEDELLAKLDEWKDDGVIRRFGAILYHTHAGFEANAMTVWNVPKERIEEVGKILASFEEVSHCYERATFPGFPYNLYAMVHAHTREECDQIVADLARAADLQDYQVLYTTQEYKKSSPVYFRKYTHR